MGPAFDVDDLAGEVPAGAGERAEGQHEDAREGDEEDAQPAAALGSGGADFNGRRHWRSSEIEGADHSILVRRRATLLRHCGGWPSIGAIAP
ncbi:hypothetical protein GCM10028833_35570 [Glycomyces tarimensis]